MGYTNETTHYGLPLPLGSDLTTPMDYNASLQDVDTALFGAVSDCASMDARLDVAEGNISTAQGDITALDGRMTTAEGKISTLEGTSAQHTLDIADVRADSQDMICAYKEASAQSTHAYNVGDYFIYNDVLYRATESIAIGDTIVPDTNCTTDNVTTEIKGIKSKISYTTHGYTWNTDNNAFYATAENANSTMRVRSRSGIVGINFNLISKGVLSEDTQYVIATLPVNVRPPYRVINGVNIYSGNNLIGLGKLSINDGVISVIFDDIKTHSEAYLQGEINFIIE